MRVFEWYMLFDRFREVLVFVGKVFIGRGGKERPDFGLLNS